MDEMRIAFKSIGNRANQIEDRMDELIDRNLEFR